MESEYLNLLRLFHDEHVEDVVVGSYAGSAHGFSCTTGGLAILVQPTTTDALVAEIAGVSVHYCKLWALPKAKMATQRPQDR
jgi:hypothetical protein